jgi:hypothetical protein
VKIDEIDEKQAIAALAYNGHRLKKIRRIQEGANHCVFDLLLEDGRPAICKFPKVRITESGITEKNIDTLFGGPLSLEREQAIFNTVRNKAGLPVPKVYSMEDAPQGKYILLEKMPGISHKEYLKQNGYTLISFLHSIGMLGKDFAKLHKTFHFNQYGDFISPGHIEPGDDNFSDRFLRVTRNYIFKAHQKGMLSDREASDMTDFFSKGFNAYRSQFTLQTAPSTLVFTDLHGENFFVDKTGKPCGYFDLESAQAAPGALEFYGFRFFLFNFFDPPTFKKAEDAFFNAYEKAGGPYTPHSLEDQGIIDFLSAVRLLEISQSYWGYIDGIRDTWGQRIYNLLRRYIQTGMVDYFGLGAIWRERDGQPEIPG